MIEFNSREECMQINHHVQTEVSFTPHGRHHVAPLYSKRRITYSSIQQYVAHQNISFLRTTIDASASV